MLITCWAAKGGMGTSVVTASLALVLAGRGESEVLLVDLDGDVPAVLGMSGAEAAQGVAEWLAAGDEAPADALARLALPVAPQLSVLPRGQGPLAPPERVGVLCSLLGQAGRTVVVDAGLVGPGDVEGAACTFAGAADHSLLVLRPCYLAIQRAVAAPLRPSAVVLVDEPGRALGAVDVEQVLRVPVCSRVPLEPSVARAVDAGLLAGRVPRSLVRALAEAA